jgi:hypothetical protein
VVLEAIPTYRFTYRPRDIPPDDLEHYVREILRQFDGLRLVHVEIDFNREYKRNVYSGKLEDYRRAYTKYREDIRKFRLFFSSSSGSIENVPWYPHLELTIRLRDRKNSLSYPRVELVSYGYRLEDFEAFERATARLLMLEPLPGEMERHETMLLMDNARRMLKHETMSAQVLPSLANRHFDVALRTASSIVEDSLRQKCLSAGRSEAAGQTGPELAVTAFHPDRGCLTPPWPVATEAQHGAQLMFQGFFLYLRNAFTHRAVVLADDAVAAFGGLALCDFLLYVIENSTARPSAG